MELLNNIQRVEAPGYLKTRIEVALEDAKVLVPQKLILLYASVLIAFVLFQWSESNNSSNTNDMESYASSIGINAPDNSYYE